MNIKDLIKTEIRWTQRQDNFVKKRQINLERREFLDQSLTI